MIIWNSKCTVRGPGVLWMLQCNAIHPSEQRTGQTMDESCTDQSAMFKAAAWVDEKVFPMEAKSARRW